MRVFIAGPYGDHNLKAVIERNVEMADWWSRELMSLGHMVYCPHTMSWGWEDDKRLSREKYLELDRSYIIHWAEALFRIPGESPGADAEVALAKELKLPIIYPEPAKSTFFLTEEYPYGSAC